MDNMEKIIETKEKLKDWTISSLPKRKQNFFSQEGETGAGNQLDKNK
jgi:hypothetical protein